MTPVIRISDSLHEKLSRLAVGFDTPAGVIERLVDEKLPGSGVDGMENLEVAKSSNFNSIIENTQKVVTVNSPKRRRVLPEHVDLACELGAKICHNKMRKKDGVDELVRKGMNPNTATIYLGNYIAMTKGGVFKVTLKAEDVRKFLDFIRKNHGDKVFVDAVSIFEQHLEYMRKHAPRSSKKEELLKEMQEQVQSIQSIL